MSDPLYPHDLAHLGLEGVELDEQIEVPWPLGQPGEARGPVQAGTLAALYLSASFCSVASDLAGNVGLSLECGRQRAHLLRVVADSRQPLDLRLGASDPATAAAAVHRPDDEPGVIVLDVARLGTVAVIGPSGGLIVRATETGLQIATVRAPIAIEPLAAIDAPAEPWAQAAGDAWVQQQVEDLLAYRSPWSCGVAAGLVARLVEPGRGAAGAAVQRLLRGEVDPVAAAPWQWARTLTDAQLRTLRDLALAEIDVLHREIEDLAELAHENDPQWRDRWRRLCHRRDNVENVRVLLHEVGWADVVNEALLDLDREGESLRLSVPWTDELADERARRVGSADPLAWWGTYSPDEVPL